MHLPCLSGNPALYIAALSTYIAPLTTEFRNSSRRRAARSTHWIS